MAFAIPLPAEDESAKNIFTSQTDCINVDDKEHPKTDRQRQVAELIDIARRAGWRLQTAEQLDRDITDFIDALCYSGAKR